MNIFRFINYRFCIAVFMAVLLGFFYPASPVFAAVGDSAMFTFAPLNGKQGENEVKLVVNTDGASINHLIFDIVNPVGGLVFDITGVNDPVSFPLSGQTVLGAQAAFTTASGDKGYDLASSNPVDVGAYTALHFATLVTDKNLSAGTGGVLSFDTDTAVYVNAQRKGGLGSSYTVLPNVAPSISNPVVAGVSLLISNVAPSASTPLPSTSVQNVSVNSKFEFSAIDSTDASVTRTMNVYKRKDDGSWSYDSSPVYTASLLRSGSDMDFSWTLTSSVLEFATYYKVVFSASDDQGAVGTETYYFSTEADSVAPVVISKAAMTFISDSNDRSQTIAQISFTESSDNGAVSNYYLWTKSYLVTKNILNEDGTRDLALDTDGDFLVSDVEFNVALRVLVDGGDYVEFLSASTLGAAPYFVLSGYDVDRFDDMGTSTNSSDDLYFVPNSLSRDIFYLVAADSAQTISGGSVPNFSSFKTVVKYGDVFGAQVSLSVGTGFYDFVTGDGALDVWDAIYVYRNLIGQSSLYPIMAPDMIHSNPFSYPSNISVGSGGTTL